MRRITRCSTCGNVFLAHAVVAERDPSIGRCDRCRDKSTSRVLGRRPIVRPRESSAPLLIVDDDPSIRYLLALVFDDLAETVEAHDYDSAIAMAQAHSPDQVICDSAVPGARREEVGVALRRLLPDALIVSFSGTGGARPWADDVVVKGSAGAVERLRRSIFSPRSSSSAG